MPHTSCCTSDHAHCMSTTYRIWHTACRIPFTSSGGASSRSSSSSSSSSSNNSSSCCCCCCRHTSCHKLMLHIRSRTPHMKGDNRRQRETTGDKTTSEPKKPTTPTNTRPLHEGRHPETMGDNGRQDHFRAQEADHTNQHPTPT